jgi:hypothetical protein
MVQPISLPMSQAAMDRDLEDARAYLGCTSLRVDRSRHERTEVTSIWVFDHGGKGGAERQIASISFDPDGANLLGCWRVNALQGGVPVSERRVATMLDACGEMMRATKNF